jgi:hypothetical protein
VRDYTLEQFVQIGKALGEKYLKVKDVRARELIAEEIAMIKILPVTR